MNRTELEKYKAILLAKQAELSGGLRNRDEILIEKTRMHWMRCNLLERGNLRFATWTVKPACCATCGRSIPYKRRQLWRLPALRGGHQAQAPGRRAVGCLLHPLPGSQRPGRVRGC
jgi:hypothetical protein